MDSVVTSNSIATITQSGKLELNVRRFAFSIFWHRNINNHSVKLGGCNFMKQKIIVISIISLLAIAIIGIVVFSSGKPDYSNLKDDDIVAEVGTEKILKKDVDNRILVIKINNQAAKKALYKNLNEEDASSMAKNIENLPSFEEQLNSMINSAKIREYLKQINVELTYDEAKELTDTNILNDIRSQTAWEFVPELIKTEGMTEETYMNSTYSAYYDVWCSNRLYEYFSANLYNDKSNDSLQEQYEKFLKTVVF